MLATGLTSVAGAAAQAQTVLLDTFGPGNGFQAAGTIAGTSSVLNAVQFSVPAGSDVSLSAIDTALAVSGTVSNPQIGIFNDSGGLPVGMPIAFASITRTLTSSLAYVSTPFPANTTLTAGHSYWAVPLISGSGSIFWGTGLAGSTTAAYYNGSSWALEATPNPLAIRVTVASQQVPCCNVHGTGCLMLLPSECATIGGLTVSSSTSCASTVCATQATGACCHGASCQVTTSLGCVVSPPGNFLGYATSCTPIAPGGQNPCCPADADNSGSLTVQDIFAFLNAWFAGCP